MGRYAWKAGHFEAPAFRAKRKRSGAADQIKRREQRVLVDVPLRQFAAAPRAPRWKPLRPAHRHPELRAGGAPLGATGRTANSGSPDLLRRQRNLDQFAVKSDPAVADPARPSEQGPRGILTVRSFSRLA